MAARVICNGGRGLGTRVSHISAVEGARVVAAESRNLAASRQKSSDPQAGHTSTARLVAVRHAAGPHVDVARPPKGVSCLSLCSRHSIADTFDYRRFRKRQRHRAIAIRLLKVPRQSGWIREQNFEQDGAFDVMVPALIND